MLLFALALQTSAFAQATCPDGASYPSAQAAAAAPGCTHVRLSPGIHAGPVSLPAGGTLSGAGRTETFLTCETGACLVVASNTTVLVEALTIAGAEFTISATLADLEVADVAIAPLRGRGGVVKLRETNALFRDVEIDVLSRTDMAIQAVSVRGDDLNFQGARFLGVPEGSSTVSAVYTVGYGVECTQCFFSLDRPASRVPTAPAAAPPQTPAAEAP